MEQEIKNGTYTIPEGFTAKIEDGKIIVEKKESEDERIRRFLVELVSNDKFNDYGGLYKERNVLYDDVLAYLENLKEQKLIQDDIEKEYVRTLKSLISDFLRGKDEVDTEYYQKIYDWLDGRHIEQTPVEIHIDNPNIQKFDPDIKMTTSDSSADGKELLHVSNKSYHIGFRDGVASAKPAEWSEAEIRTIVDDYVEGRDTYTSCINRLKSLSPQPKQDWSEEDEKMLKDVYESLYAYQCDIRAGMMDKNALELLKDVDKEKAWLKSLRPRSHWKPSEEQMAALYTAAQEAPIIKEDGNYLYDLYNDLKKL